MALLNRELQAFQVIRDRLLEISQANGFQNTLDGVVAVAGVDVYDPEDGNEIITIIPDISDSLAKRADGAAERGVMTERQINIEWVFKGDDATMLITGIPRVNDLKQAVLKRSNDRDYVTAGATVSFVSSEVGQPQAGGRYLIARLTITLNIIEKF